MPKKPRADFKVLKVINQNSLHFNSFNLLLIPSTIDSYFDWISALRSSQIRSVAEQESIQVSLFDELSHC